MRPLYWAGCSSGNDLGVVLDSTGKLLTESSSTFVSLCLATHSASEPVSNRNTHAAAITNDKNSPIRSLLWDFITRSATEIWSIVCESSYFTS